jgi:hypothetical protein
MAAPLTFLEAVTEDVQPVRLTDEDCRWLRQLESVFPTRPLLPMRTTERLGKLGLVELRSRKLMITDKGRQFLRHEQYAGSNS